MLTSFFPWLVSSCFGSSLGSGFLVSSVLGGGGGELSVEECKLLTVQPKNEANQSRIKLQTFAAIVHVTYLCPLVCEIKPIFICPACIKLSQ